MTVPSFTGVECIVTVAVLSGSKPCPLTLTLLPAAAEPTSES